jgi:hypothetical protein
VTIEMSANLRTPKWSRNTLSVWILLVGLMPLGLGAFGCSDQKLIKNTKIPDTKVNRALLRVIVRYREAMVRRDAAKVLTLVHPSYQDNAGTPEPEDDMDYERLKKMLSSRFKRASKVRYRIEFQRVDVKGREALVDTWVDGTVVYTQPGLTPRYERLADYNRYRLLLEDGQWRFISGL